MIIAIIILSILLILSIIYNILFTKGVAKLLSPENIEQRYNLIVDYYEDVIINSKENFLQYYSHPHNNLLLNYIFVQYFQD